MSKLPYLNLGCGYKFHPNWTNIDFVSNAPEVMAHNLLSGIPMNDNQFEVVYHSHVLEHFSKADAVLFIRECARVLKSGGIIRIAVPDLEMIARNYIKYLDAALEGDSAAPARYDWTMLEMYDQVVRNSSGGGMVKHLTDSSAKDLPFLIERNGEEVRELIGNLQSHTLSAGSKKYTFSQRLRSLPTSLKERLLKVLMGERYVAYQTGFYRTQGEIHQWMYDRYSLKRLLESNGFEKAVVKIGFESNIPEWPKYGLDGKDGQLRKPDSLFMEAYKK